MAPPFAASSSRNPLLPLSSSLSSRPLPLPLRPTLLRAKLREIFMPALSSTMTEGKIVSWIKSEGDRLTKGEPVVVVESDKADMDVETFHDGILASIVVPAGSSAPVGAPIALLADSSDDLLPSAKAHPTVPDKKVVATPYAKKLAKRHGVDVASVKGTGPFGRVVARDVEAAAGIRAEKPAAADDDAVVSAVAAAKSMVESLAVPGFRVGYPVMTDGLDALYQKVKSKGVTMTVLLAKAAAMALAQHPVVNASCKDGKSFSYNSSINIAVAVAIDGGLITPVLQDADKLDIYLLSQKWKELVTKARSKQLQPNEYNSGTFTLSNLGMFGVDRFDAILPPGQGAIMAVGASKPTVVAGADGFFTVKNKMLVNVTADHRIIYGADLASFLQTFSKIIENSDNLTL